MSSQDRSVVNLVVYAIAAYTVARATWDKTPDWVKKSVTGQSTTSETEKDANDDLANPVVVWKKISEVMDLAKQLTEDPEDEEVPFYKVQASFLSMIHLMNEIEESDPQSRENYFARDGQDVPEQELETLVEYLKYAEWAYNESQIEVQRLLRPSNYKLVRFDSATEPGTLLIRTIIHASPVSH